MAAVAASASTLAPEPDAVDGVAAGFTPAATGVGSVNGSGSDSAMPHGLEPAALGPRRCDTTAASTDSAISSGVVAAIGYPAGA
ncbi:MAG: hypothetical protein KGL99_12725, partial [Burkholderiales bacterium]|nr:hypothetical protein [Burkholderiales bacterium]